MKRNLLAYLGVGAALAFGSGCSENNGRENHQQSSMTPGNWSLMARDMGNGIRERTLLKGEEIYRGKVAQADMCLRERMGDDGKWYVDRVYTTADGEEMTNWFGRELPEVARHLKEGDSKIRVQEFGERGTRGLIFYEGERVLGTFAK